MTAPGSGGRLAGALDEMTVAEMLDRLPKRTDGDAILPAEAELAAQAEKPMRGLVSWRSAPSACTAFTDRRYGRSWEATRPTSDHAGSPDLWRSPATCRLQRVAGEPAVMLVRPAHEWLCRAARRGRARRDVLVLTYTATLEFFERFALSDARALGALVTVVGERDHGSR